jgi:two-component system OmpR family sensor kinase
MKVMRASSLRLRLLLGIMFAILLLWAGWFVAHATQITTMHKDRWDGSMRAVGQQILLSLPANLPEGEQHRGFNLPAQMRQEPEKMSYQVWLRSGRSLLRSSDAPNAPWAPLQFEAGDGFQQLVAGGLEWHVYTLTDADGQVQVQVGKLQSQLDRERSIAVGISVGTALLVILLVGSVTWLIICWSLAPVEDARAALVERTPLDLRPLPAAGLPSEVKPLVEAFNALLLRLEAALQGERRFLADAAHELRTPLAALMAQAQLVQSAPTLDDSRQAVLPLIHGIERSARLTEQLLDMARLDSTPAAGARPAVALHEIVSLVVRDFDGTAQAGRQRLQLHAEPCHAPVDIDAIGVLLRNLLDNALRYAGHGARVEIACRGLRHEGDECVLLSVRDDGPGVCAEDRHRIFDRFYRVPGTPGRGSGIGLSLVWRIAELHAGTIDVGDGLDGRGLGITLRLRAAPGLSFVS